MSQPEFQVSSFQPWSHYAETFPAPPKRLDSIAHIFRHGIAPFSQFPDHQNWIKDQHWLKTVTGSPTPMAKPPWIASPAQSLSIFSILLCTWLIENAGIHHLLIKAELVPSNSFCSVSLPLLVSPPQGSPRMPHGQIHSHIDKGSQFSILSSEPRSALSTNERMLWLISNKMKVQSRGKIRKTSLDCTTSHKWQLLYACVRKPRL